MTLRLRNVQVDVPAEHYDGTVAFWAETLDATPQAVSGTYTHLLHATSPVGVHLQRLESGPAGYHLDLEAKDLPTEVARLVSLGATEVGRTPDGVVLEDPAGLRFCVCPWGQVQERLTERTGEAPGVEFVVIDVPSPAHERTARFWSGALRAVAHRPPPPIEMFVYLSGFNGPGGPCHALIQDIGPDATARVHLDLHVESPRARDAEAARLQRLGAQAAGSAHHWVTLRDPGGSLLCVVPDHREDPT